MAYDRFLIAPINSGLQTDLRPWLIQDDAWEQLDNVYVFRGRIRKRFGSILTGTSPLTSRARVQIGTTDGTGALAGTVPGIIWKIGQQFSIGAAIYTVYQANGALFQTIATTTATYNTADGAYVFAGAPINTPVYFYPAEPVMGLPLFESGPINNHPTVAFDTQFAYQFAGGAWFRSVNNGTLQPTFHGNNSQFFWGTNWQSAVSSQVALFVSNFNVNVGTGMVTDDPIWSYNGTTWAPFSYEPDVTINPGATNQQPFTVTQATAVTGAIILNYVQSALIMIVFKNRLILLNTIENNANGASAFNTGTPATTGITPTNYLTSTNTAYPWRCRYSQYGSPFSRNAWLEQNQVFTPAIGGQLLNAAGGGYVDAATDEAIISAEFIKDRLIVYFERSTWELAYTGNEIQPFSWYKLNTELGSESTFSIVPFDKITLAVGEQGIHACNGANVERTDNLIPDQVFQIRTANNGVQRVWGIRDYYTELIYWTFPTSNADATANTYPNKVLVYNYKTGSWAFNDDSITAFGYFEQQDGITWATATTTWAASNFTWESATTQPDFRQIIAGNQQGFIFILAPDIGRNAPVLQITNITSPPNPNIVLTIMDHNLSEGDYIVIENTQGTLLLNGLSVPVTQVIDSNNVAIGSFLNLTQYTGGGTATRLSQINMLSKQWNPYVDKGKNVFLAKIDFGVQKTSNGQITVDYYPSSTQVSLLEGGQDTGTIIGNNILETKPYDAVPLEAFQTRLWHPIYFQGDGECIQININSAAQMNFTNIMWEDFQLEGMILHTMPTASRLE